MARANKGKNVTTEEQGGPSNSHSDEQPPQESINVAGADDDRSTTVERDSATLQQQIGLEAARARQTEPAIVAGPAPTAQPAAPTRAAPQQPPQQTTSWPARDLTGTYPAPNQGTYPVPHQGTYPTATYPGAIYPGTTYPALGPYSFRPAPNQAPTGWESLQPIQIRPADLKSYDHLTGKDNYREWDTNMRICLSLGGCKDLLSEYAKEETVPPHLKKAWVEKQSVAISVIRSTFSSLIAHTFGTVSTVHDLLELVKNTYETSGVGALQVLQDNWESVSLEKEVTVRKLANQIKEIAAGYVRVGEQHRLPDSQLVLRFLRALDDRWDAWKGNFWTNHVMTLPTFDATLHLAEAEENRLLLMIRRQDSAGEEAPRAFLAGGHTRKRAATKTPLDRDGGDKEVTVRLLQCGYCSKTGHGASDCWERFPEKRKDKRKRDSGAKRRRDNNQAPPTQGSTETTSVPAMLTFPTSASLGPYSVSRPEPTFALTRDERVIL